MISRTEVGKSIMHIVFYVIVMIGKVTLITYLCLDKVLQAKFDSSKFYYLCVYRVLRLTSIG